MHVSHLYIHPLKSGASLQVGSLDIQRRGPADDRRWMVVDAGGRFITGRQVPRMVLIRSRPQPGGLHLEAPGMPTLEVAEPGADAPRLAVDVWKDAVSAVLAGTAADDWFSDYLDQPARLVFMDAEASRPLAAAYAQPGDEVSFADGFPLLVVSARAVHDLSRRVGRQMAVERFRPNIVVDDSPAHAEDQWRRIRIGQVEFDLRKPCTRCVFTTIDPFTGRPEADHEPLRTLKNYRRSAGGVTFGVNAVARGAGRVHLGDAVELLEAGA